MDILSGSAGVLGEWLKQLRAFLSIPYGRRPNETQKYVYNKTTPVTLVQYDLYMIYDESAVSGGGLRSI